MKHTVQDLINTVYEYFPRGIADRDPAYEQTPEWQRQKAARIPASARYETWRGMLRRLAARFPKEQFPEVEVDSECYFLQSPQVAVHLDRCYTGVLRLPARARDEENHRLVFLISFVVPYYAIRSECHVPVLLPDGKPELAHKTSFDLSPGEAPFGKVIAEEIESTFPGHEPIAPEVGLTVVPDVVAGNKWFGEATIFTCLFSDAW